MLVNKQLASKVLLYEKQLQDEAKKEVKISGDSGMSDVQQKLQDLKARMNNL